MAVYTIILRAPDGSFGRVYGKIIRDPSTRPLLGETIEIKDELYTVTQEIPFSGSEINVGEPIYETGTLDPILITGTLDPEITTEINISSDITLGGTLIIDRFNPNYPYRNKRR